MKYLKIVVLVWAIVATFFAIRYSKYKDFRGHLDDMIVINEKSKMFPMPEGYRMNTGCDSVAVINLVKGGHALYFCYPNEFLEFSRKFDTTDYSLHPYDTIEVFKID